MRRLTPAAALTVVMTIGACGSDEERLSAEAFLDQGNSICEAFNAAIAEGSAPFEGREPTTAELTAFIEDTFEPNAQGAIDEIGDLEAPEDMQDGVDQFLADAKSALDEVVATKTQTEDTFAAVNASAGELGLTECGSGSDGG